MFNIFNVFHGLRQIPKAPVFKDPGFYYERNKYAPWPVGPRQSTFKGRAKYVMRKGNGRADYHAR